MSKYDISLPFFPSFLSNNYLEVTKYIMHKATCDHAYVTNKMVLIMFIH
jgi:hypothetical protein